MKLFMLLAGLIAVPSFAAAGGDLDANDYVGVSFWLVTAALLAATVFFFLERDNVSAKWRTSLTVSGLVTGIALWHYLYMRGVWVETGTSPTVFRYIDWLLTVPLLIVEFYLILRAVTDVAASLFWKLFVGSIVMLVFGYLGEAGIMAAWPAFIIGCLAWFYMIYVLWGGEGAAARDASGNAAVQSAYNTMMYIIIIGWVVYPAGYFLGYLAGGVNEGTLNLVYNLADFINKILFGIVIWAAAVSDNN
ncbi:MAG: bacteriorhodopsin-like [Gammaproteobacteria bacterium]|nr:MAG: biphenyl 2,3-dioxygenase [Gammaproteobacteria bacterium TMED104]|tara:strand:+ start:434 stop:1177 length:744 start_codon:yes stop_codon:yes gene_type:complete